MSTLLQKTEGSILTLTLNRPDKFNSFNREMAMALQESLHKAGADEGIRAVCITGEGKAFCAGQDLAEAIDPHGPGIRNIVAGHYNPIIRLIRELPKPVIAAVNGTAAGAGANIAFACDVVVASKEASFIQAFSKIGLIPDSGGTFFLPRLTGMQRASALMMLGDKLSADEAQSAGLVYKVFDSAVFMTEAMKIVSRLAEMPTRGLALTKMLLNESFGNNLEQQLKSEEEIQTQAGETADYREGVNAFLEKRKPVFTGK